MMVLVGREGLEPPVSNESGFTVRAATNYRLPPHTSLLYYFIIALGKAITSIKTEEVWHLYLVRLCYNPYQPLTVPDSNQYVLTFTQIVRFDRRPRVTFLNGSQLKFPTSSCVYQFHQLL